MVGFIVLLSFGRSLATKCVSLNYETCLIQPTLIDLNSVDLNHFSSMISLDKFSGCFNFVDDFDCKFNSSTCDSNQRWKNERVNISVNIMERVTKNYS